MRENSIIHIRDARKMRKGIVKILIQIINSDNSKGGEKIYEIDS